jgi:SAM-dependent methyltransferase
MSNSQSGGRSNGKADIDNNASGAQTVSSQYRTSENLRARGDLHSRYAKRNWFHWVARNLDIPQGGRVLDAGCGAGWFWYAATPYMHREINLDLIDISPGMVAEALRNLATLSYFKSVAGTTADVKKIPFAADTFDTVIAMHMLYHVGDVNGAISEIARVLKPGGRVVVTTNGRDNLKELFKWGGAVFGGSTSDPAAEIFGADTALRLLPAHFHALAVVDYEDLYEITDGEDIIRYLCSFPPGNQASEPEVRELRALIQEKLEQSLGSIRVARESNLILGQKPLPK